MNETSSYHFIREIYEQPAGLRQTLAESGPAASALARKLAGRIERVVLVGCGDPHFLSYAAAHSFEQFAGLPADPVEGLEFVLYGGQRLDPHTLLVAVSQSGKTIQAIQAVRLARKAGAFALAVTNSPGSPITEEADAVLLTRCGLSLSFPTKTTTSALALLFRLAVALGEAGGAMSSEPAAALRRELEALPAHVETALKLEPRMQALAGTWSEREPFSFIGTGPGYATALQGAAKLKETSQTRAEARQLEEFAHLHVFALRAGDPLFFIAPSHRPSARACELAAYAQDHGASCAALVADGDASAWQALGAEVIALPPVEETFSPIVHAVPLQFFAYHLAMAKGRDPDRPAGFDNIALQKLIYSDLLEGWHEE